MQDQVWFLGHMDRVNRALGATRDLEGVLSAVLTVVLDAIACDRAWLLYPCDPGAPTWRVPIEVTRPEYPGAHALGAEIEMVEEVRLLMRTLLERDEPMAWGPGYASDVPADVRAQFGVQVQLVMPLRPRLGNAWMFGIHQCSHARRFTDPELVLFREIGRRLADGVSTLLAFQDLRESEARLRESEELYRVLVENSGDMVALLDTQGSRVYANQALRAFVTGDPGAELEPGLGHIHPADRPEVVRAMAATLAGEKAQLPTIRMRNHHDEWRWIEGRVSPVRYRGEPHVLVFNRDITERREAQAELSLFRTLIDSTHDAIQVFDAGDARFLDVNEEACVALGYSREEYLALHLRDIDPDWNEESWTRWVATMRAGSTSPSRVFEGRHRRRDGSTFPVEVNATFIRIERDYVVAIVRDITERKQAESALREIEDQLRQSQKMEAIGQLAGGVAHDFNNLLLVINFNSELIADTLDPDNTNSRAIEEIRHAGDRAASLTRQLLAFSRKQVLHPEVVDVNVLLAELLTMLERLIGEDIEIRLVAAGELGLTEIDRAQFGQAIVNLGVNARDAMPEGGVLTISTSNQGDDSGRHVVVTVTDTGVGMDDETSARIFEPFFTTKEAGQGTGLGLAMVYGFVNQSGGHIEVHSRVGSGTTFSIHLPRCEVVAPEEQPAPPRAQRLQGTETVLVVEDADAVRLLVRDMLVSCGYTVLEARDGVDALDVARAHDGAIDLLVTDVVMPGLSGPQLAAQLEAERPALRSLMMSGYAGESLLRYRGSVASWTLLQKPFAPLTLVQRVREVLDGDRRATA